MLCCLPQIAGVEAPAAPCAPPCDDARSRRRAPPCLALGLVRSVDPEAGLLFVLTPLPLAATPRVRVMLLGRIYLPQQLLTARPAPLTRPFTALPCQPYAEPMLPGGDRLATR